MRVVGPKWPSTQRLREALEGVGSPEDVLQWGTQSLGAIEQLRRMGEAGVHTPDFTTDIEVAKLWVRDGKTVLGRRDRHIQGRDITLPFHTVEGTADWTKFNRRWLRRDLWVVYIAADLEFRQHIWNGKCIRGGQKVKTGENHATKLPIRNRRWGWTIDYSKPPEGVLRERVRDAARRAVASLDYPGGAVDLIISSNTGEVVVLEVNKAPSLRDDRTLAAYVKAIKRQYAQD